MKKILYSTFLFYLWIIPLAVFAAEENPYAVPESRMERPWWKHQYEVFVEQLNQAQDVDVLLLGDQTFTEWFSIKWLRPNYEKNFKDLVCINMSMGGNRPCNLLWMLGNAPMQKISPKVVIIYIGQNLLYSDVPFYNDDQKAVLRQLAQSIQLCAEKAAALYPQAEIKLLAILPFNRDPFSQERYRGDFVNSQLAKWNQNNSRIELIDMNPVILNENGKWLGKSEWDATNKYWENMRSLGYTYLCEQAKVEELKQKKVQNQNDNQTK